jgi:3-O-methylgallate 3,4-dioxygenase
MAEVVLGIGTSHTFMLSEAPQDWPKHGALVDPMIGVFTDAAGRTRGYAELLAETPPAMASLLTAESFESRAAEAQRCLDRLADAIARAKLDALVVIGDDQKELFTTENLPALLVYCGATIRKRLFAVEGSERPPFITAAYRTHFGAEVDDLPIAAPLATHLIEHLVDHDFDPAVSTAMRAGDGEGHAFAFVHTRLMQDGPPVPMVPVMLNTYYPPNQMRPARCLRLGRELARAIASFPGSGRIGVLASGGLSHFWVDTALDEFVLDAMRRKDAAALAGISRAKLQSGSSEILNWIALFGATQHLDHEWSAYIPGFRTPAGTGTGLAFGVWQ